MIAGHLVAKAKAGILSSRGGNSFIKSFTLIRPPILSNMKTLLAYYAMLHIMRIQPPLFVYYENFTSRLIWDKSDMEFVKNFTPSDFQAKNFTPPISPNFNSFSKKNTKNDWKWRYLHRWQKFYTAAGTDGTDKFHLWVKLSRITKYEILFHPTLKLCFS